MGKTETEIINELKSLLETEHSDYRSILRLSNELSKKDKKFQRFFVDAKTLIHLGRDSIKDHTTALVELVKNSYDADANNVEIEIKCMNNEDIIRISDNGFGMTRDQILNNWLRIGFSGKRQSKVSESGRRKTGEKGIGRISADRLGAHLELISKTKLDGVVGLKVNWDDFDIEGKDVFDIEIELTTPNTISIPKVKNIESPCGTEIIIRGLRQTWTTDNIEALYNELSALTPAFNQDSDFTISLSNDIAPEFSRKVDSRFYESAEIEITAIFDGTNEVYYSIKDRYSAKEIINTISLPQFYSKTNQSPKDTLTCGPLTVKLMFFLRDSSSIIGKDFRLSDLREFLDNNYGVKIYRDNIAVKPYGFPKAQMGFDWLKIGEEKAKNPAGIGRGKEYSVSPNQLVGAVFITRDNNTLLTDSAAREGLVETEGFSDMKEFVIATKRLLESHRVNIVSQKEKEDSKKQRMSASEDAARIKVKLSNVKDDLMNLKNDIEDSSKEISGSQLIKPIEKSINQVDSISVEVEETINELLVWQRVINGLATLGISSAVFAHETEGAITQFQASTNLSLRLLQLKEPDFETSIGELNKAIKYSKKVAAWGAYALTRVQKEKRKKRNTSIYKVVDSVIRELKPVFEASSTDLSIKGEGVVSSTFQMDIETILVNLLTNAYTATQLVGGERKVIVNVLREDLNAVPGYVISVSDNGPGVAKEFEQRIFDPLFSTKSKSTNDSKSVGTGLGLTIVKSIVDELSGKITLSKDLDLGGACFKIWLPKIK